MTVALPVLDARRRELELCTYCPKLCRAACPVSDVEARETVTPWGKMSTAFLVARGDLPRDAEHAAPAWACVTCLACRERCDHQNPVGKVLVEARADLFARGLAPEGAQRVAAGFADLERAVGAALEPFGRDADVRGDAEVALLIGCGYRDAAPEMRDAVRATVALTGGPVRLVEGCCGLPLALAGDRDGAQRAGDKLRERVRGARRLVVLDPGCARRARMLRDETPADLPPAELLVEIAAAAAPSLRPVASPPAHAVRWHDPCQMGRGLGVYDAPREVLARLLGRAPAEFPRNKEGAACSGAGGLLPSTSPASSEAIAEVRLAEHRDAGGGEIVTGCGGSLRRLRSRALPGETVSDLVSWIARGLG